MFITHNLGVVAEMAKEIVVMYMGKQVEAANTVKIFYEPKHPYTRALLQSIPKVGKRSSRAPGLHQRYGARSLPPAQRLCLPSALSFVYAGQVRCDNAQLDRGRARPLGPLSVIRGRLGGRAKMAENITTQRQANAAPTGDIILDVKGHEEILPHPEGSAQKRSSAM